MDLNEFKTLLDRQADAFESYRDDLDEVKKKTDGFMREMEGLEARLNRNGLASGGKSAVRRDLAPFVDLVRAGKIDEKSMTIGTDPTGGYLVPDVVDQVVQNQLVSLSPMRRYAKIVTLSGGAGKYSFAVNRRGATSGWAPETGGRSATDTPLLGLITPSEGEVYANPKVSQWLLDDSSFDIEAFLQENISDEFAVQEGASFVTGDGMNKPKGFLTTEVSEAVDADRAFGTIQYLKTGKADDFAASAPSDKLLDLVFALKTPYRAGPGVAWMMNSTTASRISKFKGSDSGYIWTPSLISGLPNMLLGYPVAIDENMPDIAAGSIPVAFGNWMLGYRIVDRFGTRMLRDPYTQKPFVLFYTTKRVGGAVADSNAIKFLKVAA